MAEERRFTRQEFFDLVWSTPMQQLAKEFKLSDVGLAKTCKRYNIPRPERGYWQKAAVGRTPKRPALPEAPNGADEIRFYIPDDPLPQPEPIISPQVAQWIEREHDPANKIIVPKKVGKFHPLVRKAKDALERKPTYYSNVPDVWRSSFREGIPIRVTKPFVGRACRVMQAFVTALEHRKFRVSQDRGQDQPVITVLGENFQISLDERTKRIPHVATKEELDREKRGLGRPRKWDDVPSGRLRLTIGEGYSKLQFEDRDNSLLDEQLNDVILNVVRHVIEVVKPRQERQRKDAERQAEEAHQRWLYQQDCDRFDSAYHAWREQQERLRFVAVLEEALSKLENPSDDVREYVGWTRRYVEAANPLPTFFTALAKDETPYYHEFTPAHRRF